VFTALNVWSKLCPFSLSYSLIVRCASAEPDVLDDRWDPADLLPRFHGNFQLWDEIYNSFESSSDSGSTSITNTRPTPSFVYLFLPAPPRISTDVLTLQSWYTTLSQSYYWSLDEDGKTRLSEDECRRKDLPQLSPGSIEVNLHSWSSDVYDALSKYQIARGFNPAAVRTAHTSPADASEDVGIAITDATNSGSDSIDGGLGYASDSGSDSIDGGIDDASDSVDDVYGASDNVDGATSPTQPAGSFGVGYGYDWEPIVSNSGSSESRSEGEITLIRPIIASINELCIQKSKPRAVQAG
ncbi:hypothetical protein MPER_05822, partial [Moniliophthora perniciosa FA553]